ncbi:gustatory receptor 179 [Tribolium castaneum]|uniref:Gustatory receptor n=1 Tax=Tribolium castaneum TaxID=7070 RepID=D7EL72_TRICA|nr:gustatory receptor 179 [Tribolium castaneum]
MSNQFGYCPFLKKIIPVLKLTQTKLFVFLKCFLTTILAIFSIYNTFNKFANRLFVIRITAIVYIFLDLLYIGSIVVSELTFEHTLLNIVNHLMTMEEQLPKRKSASVVMLLGASFLSHIVTIGCVISFVLSEGYSNEWDNNVHVAHAINANLLKTWAHVKFTTIFFIISKDFEELNKVFYNCSNQKRRNVMHLHMTLSNISRQMNTIFSFVLVFSVAFYFVNLIARIIQIYCMYAFGTSRIHNHEAIGLAVETFRLLVVVWVSKRCMCQANEIKNVVCKILINTRNKVQRKEFNAYALQMFHETLEITAGGCFVIDFTLIFTIITAGSNYVVIILQFLYYDNQYTYRLRLWN